MGKVEQNRASEASEWCQIMAKGLNRIDLHPGMDELIVEEIRFIFKMEMVKPGNICKYWLMKMPTEAACQKEPGRSWVPDLSASQVNDF